MRLTHHDGNMGYGSVTQEDLDAYQQQIVDAAKHEQEREAMERVLAGEDN